MILGERLKQLREHKYSQEELAELLNVHNNTISKWENGTQEPRMKYVKEMARLLGTTSAYLLGDTDNPTPNFYVEHEFNDDKKTGIEEENFAYWAEMLDKARRVAVRGNLREISFIEVFVKSAYDLLIMGKERTVDIGHITKQSSSVDMSHWNNNNLTGSSVYAGNTVTQA